MAIFAIIALGVGFFTGLKASKPAMMETGVTYVREQKLFDYRLLSTWGFEKEEIDRIRELEGVEAAEGAVWEDFIYVSEDGAESCFKALSITEQVNRLTVQAGRLPEKADECVLDGYRYPESMIGQKITISQENSQETKDSFAYDTYTVTGLVRSPIYMNMERGTTTIGSGKVDGFLFIPLEGFSYDYFKEVYVVSDTGLEAFSEEYQTYIEDSEEQLEKGTLTILEERYQKEISDAEAEIADGEQELESKTADARQELADAKKKLEDGEQELTKSEQKLADAEKTFQEKEQELTDGEAALKDGEAKYRQGLAEYEQGLADYQKGMDGYQSGMTEYQAGYDAYVNGSQQLEANRPQYEQALAGKQQMESSMPPEMLEQNATYRELSAAVKEFETKEQELAQTKVQLENVKKQLEDTKAQLEEAKAQLSEAKSRLDASYVQITENRNKIEDGKEQLAQGKQELADGRQEIADGKQDLADGWKEYEDGKKELETETAEARQELADAKEELADVEMPKVYVLERSTNVGYASYESDVSIVEGIAKIFPVFFFLIAALVCSTTMTRMVDDERTQIGTLRALGYSKGAILSKYLIYSGSAAGLGAVAGYFLGTRLFPTAIWTAYGMLYGFADIIITDDIWLFSISLLVALLCSAGTTFAACRMELVHAPAELIRPKAPSAGKRILLERIPFIWKRLKFLHKVSARNVFRFKKRMVMMILGIAGCTSLVMAGFGIRDSVTNIANNQYDQILKYDISATYSEEVTGEMLEEIEEQFGDKIAYSAVLQEISVDAPYKGGVKTVTLMVSEDEKIRDCVDFHVGEEPIELPGNGEVLMDKRLSQTLSAEVGDEVIFRAGEVESKPAKVAGVFENYIFYYGYMTGETYQECFGEAFTPKTIYLSLEEGADHYKIASYLSNMENASNITVVADNRARVENMMHSMNFIVVLVICCAAALAFIVLFNLGNINISERVREIATLKVLGFYPRETGAYVFRENVVLSVMGIIVGLPLGVLLHRFVMDQIRIDMVSFEVQIRPLSFIYSVVAVLSFTVCVDLIMRRKIDRINMAESLKSIE